VTRDDRDTDLAVEKYVEFHRYEPADIGTFAAAMEIPAEMVCVGPATHVLYRSGKVDPATLRLPKRPRNYIHDHDAGVFCYVPMAQEETDGETVRVPAWIREVKALTLLGQCLGFRYRDEDGDVVCVEGIPPMPELYCTPDGRCLLVIQDKRQVLAAMWGGVLGVEGRGIVG
jgi:hypothetical protein